MNTHTLTIKAFASRLAEALHSQCPLKALLPSKESIVDSASRILSDDRKFNNLGINGEGDREAFLDEYGSNPDNWGFLFVNAWRDLSVPCIRYNVSEPVDGLVKNRLSTLLNAWVD